MARLCIDIPAGLGREEQDEPFVNEARSVDTVESEQFTEWVGCWAGDGTAD